MKNAPEKQISPVRRITIDERLADDLIRLLIANLKNNVTTFADDSKYWEEEEELLVRPGDYQKKMGMTRANVKKWPWKNLREGQVFLRGRFRVRPNQPAGVKFFVDMEMKRKKFRHIDYLIKDLVKKLYMNALERSIPNGETDQTG